MKSELEKRQYQAFLDYPLYSFYGECFEWVDTVDYRNTEMYDPKLQNMEKWQLFLLEVFFQTHPSHQTAEAKSAKYQRPAQGSNNNVDPELEEKKRSRISKLTALTYPATLRKLVTMDQDQKRDFEAYCKKDSKKRACTITFDGEEGPQIKTNKPTSKNKMYKKSL